jgi:formylglycine-generating enzyme
METQTQAPAELPHKVIYHPDMVWIPGGTFRMGIDEHHVTVSSFWMDVTTVTNEDFSRFVRATGYMTVAERPLDPQQYPGADVRLLVPGALVFRKPPASVDSDNFRNWWDYVPGACWRNPDGPGSSIAGLARHPVVQVAYEDALAYASWAGKDLPTEAEWEFAAQGGLDGTEIVRGEEHLPGGMAPVRSFPPNQYGLYDMIGNVWEWTLDWYRASPSKGNSVQVDPFGPFVEQSYDERMPKLRIPRKVLKGGSFLCAPSSCRRYRPAARYARMIDTAACHIGFRCVLRHRGGLAAIRRLAAAGE